MTITKIEVRVEVSEGDPSHEIWEIEHIAGRKEVLIRRNGLFVASNGAGSKPLDSAYETMIAHVTEAYNKMIVHSIVEDI